MGKKKEVSVDSSKPWWHSKTVWVNVLMLLGVFFTELSSWVSSSPEGAITVFALVNFVLRFITSSKIQKTLF